MGNFKVGDIVECVGGGIGWANEVVYTGNRYTVAEYSGRTLKVDEMGWKWCTSRFKKVEKQPMQNIQEIKQYKTPDGRVFDTIEDAEAWLTIVEIKDILWSKSVGVAWDNTYNEILSKFNITRK